MFILVKSSLRYSFSELLIRVPDFVLKFDKISAYLRINWNEVKRYINYESKINITSLLGFWCNNFGKEIYFKVSKIVEKYEERALESLIPFLDVKDLLKELVALGKIIYVATKQSRKPVRDFLKRYSLISYFLKNILSKDEYGSNVDQLSEIIKRERVRHFDILFINNLPKYVYSCIKLRINYIILPDRGSFSSLTFPIKEYGR